MNKVVQLKVDDDNLYPINIPFRENIEQIIGLWHGSNPKKLYRKYFILTISSTSHSFDIGFTKNIYPIRIDGFLEHVVGSNEFFPIGFTNLTNYCAVFFRNRKLEYRGTYKSGSLRIVVEYIYQ